MKLELSPTQLAMGHHLAGDFVAPWKMDENWGTGPAGNLLPENYEQEMRETWWDNQL